MGICVLTSPDTFDPLMKSGSAAALAGRDVDNIIDPETSSINSAVLTRIKGCFRVFFMKVNPIAFRQT